jgi:hypothetical protein
MTTKTPKREAIAGMFASGVVGSHIARLTDPEPAQALKKLEKRFKDEPGFAKEWLIRHSLLTRTGKLPKRFGG